MVGWIGALTVAGVVGSMAISLPATAAIWLVFAGVVTGLAAFLPEPGQKRKRRAGQLA